nr:response regulator transcription factor [Streptosporangium roseum]
MPAGARGVRLPPGPARILRDRRGAGRTGSRDRSLHRLADRRALPARPLLLHRVRQVVPTRGRGTGGGEAGPKVIVLTTFDLDEYAFAALRAGASGFLLKDAPAEEIVAAVRTVHEGDAVIAPSTTRRLLDHVAPTLPLPADPPIPLTDREREVLQHIAQGETNAEIAGRLFLSEGTVKTHVGRILAKLQLRDRVQAVIWAYEHGQIPRI